MKQETETSYKLPGVKISLEGIDGSGKTTQTLLLQCHLERMGYRVFRAPDNSDASDTNLDGKILTILRQERDRFFRIGHPITENLLLASRAAFLDETVTIPKLKSGYVVLSDRDIDTFIAYGIPSLQDIYPNKQTGVLIDWMVSIVSLGRKHPDLTILFRPNLGQFLSRATVGVYETNQKDNFNQEDWKFMEKVAEHYEQLQKMFPERILTCNIAHKDKQQVLEELLQIIIPFLEKRNVPKQK